VAYIDGSAASAVSDLAPFETALEDVNRHHLAGVLAAPLNES
jgi:hypothetical protein